MWSQKNYRNATESKNTLLNKNMQVSEYFA